MDITTSFPVISPELHIYSSAEISKAFESDLPVYFDTMVLQNLWKLHVNPRRSLLASIKRQESRTYLPYQTQVELYRHAFTESVFGHVPTPGLFESASKIEVARGLVLDNIGKVRPLDSEEGPSEAQIEQLKQEAEERFNEFIEWHSAVDEKVRQWLGGPVDLNSIRRGDGPNRLLDEVAQAFGEGHLLPKFSSDRQRTWRDEYRKRIRQDDPVGPGKTDSNKESEDLAAGDYFMWREIIEHCKEQAVTGGFIFVTEERKPDLWEFQQSSKAVRRIDPRIQAQVIDEIGGPMLVVSFDEFIRYTTHDVEARKMLVEVSEDARSKMTSGSAWNRAAYTNLLEVLHSWGNDAQRDVIVEAARRGGSILRGEIGEVLGWNGENRYLTRFRMPADRGKNELVLANQIDDGSPDPLWAVYEGPGEAVGYAVPDEFVEFQRDLDEDKRAIGE